MFLVVLKARVRASVGKAVAWVNTTTREVLRAAPVAVGLLCDPVRWRDPDGRGPMGRFVGTVFGGVMGMHIGAGVGSAIGGGATMATGPGVVVGIGGGALVGSRRISSEYVEHYHRERNHPGLDKLLLMAPPANEKSTGPVQCRERLGGTLRFYYRDAA